MLWPLGNIIAFFRCPHILRLSGIFSPCLIRRLYFAFWSLIFCFTLLSILHGHRIPSYFSQTYLLSLFLFPPLLNYVHSHLSWSHCDSASTFSVQKQKSCPAQRSRMLTGTRALSHEISISTENFVQGKKVFDFESLKYCKEEDLAIWLNSQNPKEKGHKTSTYNVHSCTQFLFICNLCSL